MRRPPFVPRDNTSNRGQSRLAAEALENDLRASSRVERGASVVQVVSNGGGGGGGVTGFIPHMTCYLQCQSNDADENLRTRMVEILSQYDEARLVVHQANSGGGTYDAEFWDGVAWVNLGEGSDITLVHTGGGDVAQVTGWQSIKAGARLTGGVDLRVDQSGGGGSTDVAIAAIQFRGPAIVGEQGEPGAGSEIVVEDDSVSIVANLTSLNLMENLSVLSYSGGEVLVEAWEPVSTGDWEDAEIVFGDGDVVMHPPEYD